MSAWKVHSDVEYHFCTSTVVNWYPIFTSVNYFKILIDSLDYCRKEKGLKVHGYVIMLNHIHLLISTRSSSTVSDIMRDFKRFTSRKISTTLKQNKQQNALNLFFEASQDRKDQNYKIWQDGFHPIGIESEKFLKEKLNYIHLNPVRKRYVLKPEHWVYSSARNYAGDEPTPLTINCLF